MRIFYSWRKSGQGSESGTSDENICGRSPWDGGIGVGASVGEKSWVSDFDEDEGGVGFNGCRSGGEVV